MPPRIDRLELAAVGAGGVVGALTRVGLSQAFPSAAGHWPWATFAVNIVGTFLLGLLLALLRRRAPVSIPLYRLLGTGFCGTLTTFSTAQVELLRMLDKGHEDLALAYLTVSVAGGYLAISLAARLVGEARVGRYEPERASL
jgi:CrcB protein